MVCITFKMQLELQLLRKYKRHMKDLQYMGDGEFAPATSAQRRYIHQLLGLLEYDVDDYKAFRDHDMTVVEASELITELKDELDGGSDNDDRYRNRM